MNNNNIGFFPRYYYLTHIRQLNFSFKAFQKFDLNWTGVQN